MLIIHYFALLINLGILKCASIEAQNNANSIQAFNSEDSSERDIVSRHLNELEYDAKSMSQFTMSNQRAFSFFEGAGWDMSELANIWKFGVSDAKDLVEFESEKSKILDLSPVKDEFTFNESLENLLFKEKVFKSLARPVIKYLIRRLYERKEQLNDENGAKLRKYLVFAVENRLYDIFFELSKDSTIWNGMTLEEIIKGKIDFVSDNQDSFYFDCYNNYVYDNRAANEYMQSKLTEISPNYYILSFLFPPYEDKSPLRELSAWTAVCIYRRTPEETYAPYLSKIPEIFLDIIQEFIFKYSPITFDNDEKDYFHDFIFNILDKHFGDNKSLESSVKFAKILNDIRFGNVNESLYQDQILPIVKINSRKKLEILIMAASKANNKLLVKQLTENSAFSMRDLFRMVEHKNPHSFKVYFDMIESEPHLNVKNGAISINYAHTGLIKAILWNNIKVTKAIKTNLGNKFEIQSPTEYIELGFASKYEILLESDEFIHPQYSFIIYMLNDAAKAGAEEFIQLINDHCGEHIIGPVFTGFQTFEVSYEVIQILLEHQELIRTLANRSVKLYCFDERINPEEIANFNHVINPNTN